MIEESPKPHAIIIGLDSLQGLQSARILARIGIPVIGLANNPKYHSCYTRVCKRIIFCNTATEELIAELAKLGSHLRTKAVLFPCQDNNVLLVSRHREDLKRWYHIVLPSANTVELMMDKVAFYEYAQRHGFPVPRTFALYSRADAEHAAHVLSFPCCLKPPYRPPRWTRHTKQKAFKAENAAELLALYDHYHGWADALVAQEWIAGSDRNHYTCNCYFDLNSRPLVTLVSHKLRQWPPGTGQACLAEECRNERVYHETLKLFSHIDFKGLAYLEMKQDENSGRYLIIEPNVGRPTGRAALAEACGIPLLHTMYCDSLGMELPAARGIRRSGVKWIHLLRDTQSAIHHIRRGELTLRSWFNSLKGKKAYAIFSWKDPLPFFVALKNALSVFFSAREQGKEDLQQRSGRQMRVLSRRAPAKLRLKTTSSG